MVCTTYDPALAPLPTALSPSPAPACTTKSAAAGPLLLVIGAPMASADFAPLADALATDHTVVTYDPRGIADSTIDDPDQDSTPELRADDVAAILDDLGAESADVFGSSGGAVTGLALVVRHPGRVRTLIAHEPPLLELLPDAARATREHPGHHRHVPHRWHAGRRGSSSWSTPASTCRTPRAPSCRHRTNRPRMSVAKPRRFFDHELWHTTQYMPDVEALKASPTRVLVGHRGGLRTSADRPDVYALAELLGNTTVEFPGDHGGFMEAPTEFADAALLRGAADA